MPTKPDCPQYKSPDEYDVSDHLAVQQARHRDEEPPKIERQEWRDYKAAVLEEAGLAAEQYDEAPKPLEEQSVGEHLDRVQAANQPG